MGVDVNAYVVYGMQVPEDMMTDDEDDFISAFYDNEDRFEKCSLVYDGMCGQYAVFGSVLSELGPYEDSDFVDIDITDLDDRQNECLEELEKALPEYINRFSRPWKIISFMHYS